MGQFREKYPELGRRIEGLKDYAKPLSKGIPINQISDLVSRIMGLPDTKVLKEMKPEDIRKYEEIVSDIEIKLNKMAYTFVEQLLKKVVPTEVFQAVKNENEFRKTLEAKVGEVFLVNGEEVILTKEIIDGLLKYKFSIGTPPATLKGGEAIAQRMLGGNIERLHNSLEILTAGENSKTEAAMYALLGRFEEMISQSTQYTTEEMLDGYLEESIDFPNQEGVKGFAKTVISGTTESVIDLIKRRLLEHHDDKKTLKVYREDISIEKLSEVMAENPNKLFVIVREQNDAVDFQENEKLINMLGRLIIVDGSKTAKQSGTVNVYAIMPKIIDGLSKLSIKDSGTQSNVQLNLRLILEKFSGETLSKVTRKIEERIGFLEKEHIQNLKTDDLAKKDWARTAMKEYVMLKNFYSFVELISYIKNSTQEEVQLKSQSLTKLIGEQASEYWFKGLDKSGFSTLSIPQGGGRRAIGMVAEHHAEELENGVAEYIANGALDRDLERLGGLSVADDVLESAIKRAVEQQRPDNVMESTLMDKANDMIGAVMAKITSGVEKTIRVLDVFEAKTGKLNTVNVLYLLREAVNGKLDEKGIGALKKLLERGNAKKFERFIAKLLGYTAGITREKAEQIRAFLERLLSEAKYTEVDTIKQFLSEVKDGVFKPRIASGDISWTYKDVLIESMFPKENIISLDIDEQGRLNLKKLKDHMEHMELVLHDFTELLDLYKKSILVIFNDPHNPTASVATSEEKLELLRICTKYGLAILADESYTKLISKDIKDIYTDKPLVDFYIQNRGRLSRDVKITSVIPTTKVLQGAGWRNSAICSNIEGLSEYVGNKTNDQSAVVSGYFANKTYELGDAVKSATKKLEKLILSPQSGRSDLKKIIEELFRDMDSKQKANELYFMLLDALNTMEKLDIRAPLDIRVQKKFLSQLISNIKQLRTDKRVQKDVRNRIKHVNAYVEGVCKKYGVEFTKPQGAFYFLIKMKNSENEEELKMFLERFIQTKGVGAVRTNKGYIRYAFGGMLDGSEEGYKKQAKAIGDAVELMLKYWEKFKKASDKLREEEDENSTSIALESVLPLEGIGKVLEERQWYDGGKSENRVVRRMFPREREVIYGIDPRWNARVVTLPKIECESIEVFLSSNEFKTLYEYFLLKVKNKIPEISMLTDAELRAEYGVNVVQERFEDRMFQDNDRQIFEKIMFEVAKVWFSPSTTKTMAIKVKAKDAYKNNEQILGYERKLSAYIKQLLDVFLPTEMINKLKIGSTIQIGYEVVTNAEADESLPQYTQNIVKNVGVIGGVAQTDESTEVTTAGKTRAPGKDLGLYKRDGDGVEKPTKEHFRNRLIDFSEKIDNKKYECKMVEVGPFRVLLVLNKAYSHYLADELRLFKQKAVGVDIKVTDVDPEELTKLKFDGMSLMGTPQDVFGADFRVGYFNDGYIDEDGNEQVFPVSWVDLEMVTDYMGYLKKPILTVVNEVVKERGGFPIHGSAFKLVFKDGRVETVVIAGDSGTGKSETIIALMKMITSQDGLADQLEGIEILAGDMLALWDGEDGMYMTGTETGDFMRMSDLPPEFAEIIFKDKVAHGARSNMDDERNPRITVPDMAEVQGLTKVGHLYVINNFEKREGDSILKIEDVEKFTYHLVIGLRGEKGTSGDQPNIFHSIDKTTNLDSTYKDEILKYGNEIDDLLEFGDFDLNEIGKVKEAYLIFRDVPGKSSRAKEIIDKIFIGTEISIKNGDENVRVTCKNVEYSPIENKYYFVHEKGKGVINKSLFIKLFEPIVSTFCGNPFMDPEGMDKNIHGLQEMLRAKNISLAMVYTQLKVKGREEKGPQLAARGIARILMEDEDGNREYLRQKQELSNKLRKKYGKAILGKEDIHQDVIRDNYERLIEHQENSAGIRHLITGETVDLGLSRKKGKYKVKLLTRDIERVINGVIKDEDAKSRLNLESFNVKTAPYFKKIKKHDSVEELVYQILLINGTIKLGQNISNIRRIEKDILKAFMIAEKMRLEIKRVKIKTT